MTQFDQKETHAPKKEAEKFFPRIFLILSFFVHSARDHICKSIDILRSLLPKDHLLLSSARRVKALILEEIALDNFNLGDNGTGKSKIAIPRTL